MYAPSASGPRARGDVQLAYVPVVAPGPSSLHSNVEPGFVEVNANDGEVTFVGPVGPVVIVVSGAAVSTVNVRVAGVASTLPAASRRADGERVRPVGERPTNAATCSRIRPGRGARAVELALERRPASVDVNVNDGVVTFVGARRAAGDRRVRRGRVDRERPRRRAWCPALPGVSVARTENV